MSTYTAWYSSHRGHGPGESLDDQEFSFVDYQHGKSRQNFYEIGGGTHVFDYRNRKHFDATTLKYVKVQEEYIGNREWSLLVGRKTATMCMAGLLFGPLMLQVNPELQVPQSLELTRKGLGLLNGYKKSNDVGCFKAIENSNFDGALIFSDFSDVNKNCWEYRVGPGRLHILSFTQKQ